MKIINPATEEIIKEVKEDTKEALQGSLIRYKHINIMAGLYGRYVVGAYYLITNQAFFYHL